MCVCVKERGKQKPHISKRKIQESKMNIIEMKRKRKRKRKKVLPAGMIPVLPFMINVCFVLEFQSKLLSTTSLHPAPPPSATGVVTLMSALPIPSAQALPGRERSVSTVS